MFEHDDYPDDFDENYKSKSQVKREMHALQALGEELLTLNKEQLAKIPLPELLQKAIAEWHRLKAREAKRRQLQYIGKLMRSCDADPIEQALAIFKNKQNEQTRFFHQVEYWRDKVVAEGDEALNEFIAQHPQSDRNQLRGLVRQAKKEVEKQQHGKNFKQLFRELRLIMEQQIGQ